jgi:hypothetical protein
MEASPVKCAFIFRATASCSSAVRSGPSPTITKRAVGICFCTLTMARSKYLQPFFSTKRPTKRMRLGSRLPFPGLNCAKSVPM